MKEFIPFSDPRAFQLTNPQSAVRVCGEVFTADAHDMAMSNALQKFGDIAEAEMKADPDNTMGYLDRYPKKGR